MKDSGYARPEAVEIERKDDYDAIVWICTDVVERTDDDGLVVYDYNRYGLEVIWTDGLLERVRKRVTVWLEAAKKIELAIHEDDARRARDRLLADTDYLMAPDYPINPEQRAAVADYRQALRDLPEAPGWPTDHVMPRRPDVGGGGDTILDVLGAMLGGDGQ